HRQGLDGDQPGNGDDDRDDDRQPGAIDEEGRQHGVYPFAASAPATTCPGLTRWIPSVITRSPASRPDFTTMSASVRAPVSTLRTCTLFSLSTTRTNSPAWSACRACCGTTRTGSGLPV